MAGSDGSDQKQLILANFPKQSWGVGDDLYQYEGFWCPPDRLKSLISIQREFEPLDTDLILATLPKSGTIWLKAMAYAIVYRGRFSPSSKTHPLLTTLSHILVPFIEYYQTYHNYKSFSDFNSNYQSQTSRLLSTHVPFTSLPESIKKTTKIVYLCRNPKDNFISLWKYLNKRRSNGSDPFPLEKAFDLFCNGVSLFGPFWDHMLGYWKQSLQNPQRVLFLKYEDLKREPRTHLKTLAEFLGYPFSLEDEESGVVEEILSLCNFEFMKNLDVNKNGSNPLNFGNSVFFRKAQVGDWKNHLTPSMAQRIDRLSEEKLHGSGLVFEN
ncbi:hypothetical protein MKX03_006600 [Papaver bracteatum]|nr:hypothetical protein MKX03_006600 [Papaver bracteatum]